MTNFALIGKTLRGAIDDAMANTEMRNKFWEDSQGRITMVTTKKGRAKMVRTMVAEARVHCEKNGHSWKLLRSGCKLYYGNGASFEVRDEFECEFCETKTYSKEGDVPEPVLDLTGCEVTF